MSLRQSSISLIDEVADACRDEGIWALQAAYARVAVPAEMINAAGNVL